MIKTLADAWTWYESTRQSALTLVRLGEKHWDALPWNGDLGRDERLKALDSAKVLERANVAIDELDDLCILMLFSVFEAIIRDRVLAEVTAVLPSVDHLAVQQAIEDLKEAIEQGSFFKVLEPYKATHASLVEEVNQVRRYRNWVAHGRRTLPPHAVTPIDARDRLQRFLDRVETKSQPSPS